MNPVPVLQTIFFVLLFSAQLLAQPPYQAGEAVEIIWNGTWHNAWIVEEKAGLIKISYDEKNSGRAEWVDQKRLRRKAADETTNNASPALQTASRPNPSDNYRKGDRVEVNYVGDWYRATIIDGPKMLGSEMGYDARTDGSAYTDYFRVSAIRPLYRSNEKQAFSIGQKVLFRRWDGKEYEAEVIGVDEGKYNLSYQRDGYKSTEWIAEMGVKESPNTTSVVARKFPGQKYNVGDRVMYHSGSFLTKPSFGTIVSVDTEKRLYTIKDEKDASSRYTYPCYGVLAPGERPDNSFFVGKWEVYVAGATSTFTKDGDRYRRFSSGMKLNTLTVNADGTYVWQTGKKVIRGNWQARDGVPGITMLKGIDGLDWTVYQNTENLAAGKTTRDEIRFHHIPSSTGYYMAYRIGANKSCALVGRNLK